MDTRNLIDTRLAALPNTADSGGIRSVLNHIDAAERHLRRAMNEQDDQLFNDVVYRCNQAFEGSLKEAYFVLSGNASDRKTPNDIEKYFETNGVLHKRVLDLFTRYRQDWRNPSTHDYRLIFRESEAVLALLSVTSFFIVLLDQILEHLARANPPSSPKPPPPDDATPRPLLDEVGDVVREVSRLFRVSPHLTEAQILGGLAGGLEALDTNAKVLIEPKFADDSGVIRYPDLIIVRGKERVVIEVKRGPKESALKSGENELLSYLSSTSFSEGGLIVLSPGPEPIRPRRVEADIGGKNFSYVIWA